MSEDPSVVFSAFIARSRSAPLPPEIERAAARAFANWLACALGGARDPLTDTHYNVARGLSGRDDASVIGRDAKLDVVNAALVNGVAANALDYDDMHAPTLIHPTGAVVAAALALGEQRRVSGRVLLAAIATGIEVECRLGLALFPEHYDAGWHSTATMGTLGACAAACVVIGLDQAHVQHALGIAATQASGLRAMLSSSCKSFNIGKAASAGALAALLAEAGLDSEPRVLDAKHGFFATFGKPRDPQALTADLGKRYLLPEVSLKPYPCGVVIHPLIDACLAISETRTIGAADVERIAAFVHPRAIELANRPKPENALAGRYSLQHAAALALTRRSAGLAAFDEADVFDPALVALRDRMSVQPDAKLTPSQARVVVELANGGRLEHFTEAPSGSPARPLTDAQLRGKFMELAQRVVAAGEAERLYALCLGLSEVTDLRTLTHCQMEVA